MDIKLNKMKIIIIIYLILMTYLLQMGVCAIIHLVNLTPIPKSGWGFVKLTFLPWVIMNFKKLKEQ